MVIINMEIPKSCKECPMNHGEYSTNEIEKRSCCLTHKQFVKTDYKKRPTNCPILEEQDYKENAVDIGYLYDWYQTSVTDDPPVWTDEHIKELFGDFYCIPKPEPET